MTTTQVIRRFNCYPIEQRSDGYMDATAMCKANGRKLNSYLRSQGTKLFLEELSSVTQICATVLVQIKQGGNASEQATYVHPRVAMHLAQWCSAKFAVVVSGWVIDILTTGRCEIAPTPAPAPLPPPPPALPAVLTSDCAVVIPNFPDYQQHPLSERLAQVADDLEPILAIPGIIKQLRNVYDQAVKAMFAADGMAKRLEWMEGHAKYLMGEEAKRVAEDQRAKEEAAAKATLALPALTDAERIARLERQVAELVANKGAA